MVSRIGFGAMQLARLHEDRDAAIRLVRRAVDSGVDHIDTAQFYGNGFVNEVIRAAVPGAEITIVSKVGADPGPAGPYPTSAQRPGQLRASVEANLAALGLDRIPVVNLRRNDVGFAPPAEGDQVVDLDDQLAEMIALRTEGKIGAIGLSSVTLDGLRRALPAGIVCVQNPYSLVDRADEEMLELCAAQRIAWVPYFPLGSAVPGAPKVTEEPVVTAVAGTLGATPAQIGLSWLLHRAPNVLLIPGAADEGHLEANLATGRLTLDAAAMTALAAVPSRALPYPR
ncbi:aryl-alcohol dehydrogenase-like predicted oxidoreductase [Crossiella cryophila]|uniref:Aryl-alcohol dehydrogenase-like predicted oxidoreductase n=1 Tax=Crossiella cryophila TaxID=43355 RepID=A0A7W7CBR5_9PSEU|nr:aryl-alcohol dehydrogenase-like predicted oxidoreductase [Crossiella cryophila]